MKLFNGSMDDHKGTANKHIILILFPLSFKTSNFENIMWFATQIRPVSKPN